MEKLHERKKSIIEKLHKRKKSIVEKLHERKKSIIEKLHERKKSIVDQLPAFNNPKAHHLVQGSPSLDHILNSSSPHPHNIFLWH